MDHRNDLFRLHRTIGLRNDSTTVLDNLCHFAGVLCGDLRRDSAMAARRSRGRHPEGPREVHAQPFGRLTMPGMIGEAMVLTDFGTFMPRIQETSGGKYGALLFATYALVLGMAEAASWAARR